MTFDKSRQGWISRGFEELVKQAETPPVDAVHFDVLIIGSGYGGAIAAATFAGRKKENGTPVTVGVLERGQEYLSGAFPSGPGDAPGHMRMDRNKNGLFDVRPGPEVNTVLANGLGGGSLFNAGVMETPFPSVFNDGWPAALNFASLAGYYDRCKLLLGSALERQNGVKEANTIDLHPDGLPQKHRSIKALANGNDFRSAELTIAMTDSVSSGNVKLNKCIRCGDCATGCNFGAKNSLDLNLLVSAHRAGAKIYTGATVLDIERDETKDTWIVNCVYTNDQLRARHGEATKIRTKRLLLAAGTLGTSEILQRSTDKLQLSDKLGKQCSTNGDMLITDYATTAAVNAVADESVKPSEREIGPTITGIIDGRDKSKNKTKKIDDLVIEELAVPGTLRRVFSEVFATSNALYQLSKSDTGRHKKGFPDNDIYAVGEDQVKNSAIYAAMGNDGAKGSVDLRSQPLDYTQDGTAFICWNKTTERKPIQENALFARQTEGLEELSGSTGGKILPNPVWRLLPEDQSFLTNGQKGPLLTVHPLGGCVMADDVSDGVVDDIGRVYNSGQPGAVYEGLAILDGSVIPTALGTNPALTISAVALRAAEALAVQWNYTRSAATPPGAPDSRPTFRDDADVAKTLTPTEVSVKERLSGEVRFRDKAGKTDTYEVELTVRYKAKKLAEFYKPPRDGGNPVLELDPSQDDAVTCSRIRIFEIEKPLGEPVKRGSELFSAPLSGRLFVLERQKSGPFLRRLRCIPAWLANRGIRDAFQGVTDKSRLEKPGIFKQIKNAWALASRGGEMRQMRYELDVGAGSGAIQLRGSRIIGIKKFTYAKRCNPWRQLMELELTRFPGRTSSGPRRVDLDLDYLTDIEVPLFQITRQENGVQGLAELASFFTWLTRQLIGIHIWSFRKPDSWKTERTAMRLPSELPGVAKFERHREPIGKEHPHHDGAEVKAQDVEICLTRYPRPESGEPPIIMIHGYSASGTSFAHHTIDDSYASHLWHKGRDVWILDMRTSPGMPTAEFGWSFEQVAYSDIPHAIDYVLKKTGAAKIDVIAHCMGAVMFSMAVLHADRDVLPDKFKQQRNKLPLLINRVVFSQVGPLVVFSPINRFRSLFARYLTEFLPGEYSFKPDNPTLADDLLDRLLYSLPYPESEFKVENPSPLTFWKRTPWTRTRHRMDALYGRDFNVDNNRIDANVLHHIDDFFGPMSIKTVSQTIHFARFKTITSVEGHNSFVARALLNKNWKFPTLSIHGRKNGLSDVATVDRMKKILGEDAGRTYYTKVIEDAGHQDCLIGVGRKEALDSIDCFYSKTNIPDPREADTEMTALVPWIGPLVTQDFSDWSVGAEYRSLVTIRIGASPVHNEPAYVILLKVHVENGLIQQTAHTPFTTIDDFTDHYLVIEPDDFKKQRWGRFIVPPDFFPTGPQDPKNAVLVLIAYAEDLILGATSELSYTYFAPQPGIMPFGELVSFPFQDFLYANFVAGAPMDPAILKLYSESQDQTTRPGPPPPIEIAEEKIPEAARPATISSKQWERIGDAVLKRLQAQPGINGSGNQDHPGAAGLPNNKLLDGVVTFIPDLDPPESPVSAGVGFALGSCQYPSPFIDRPVGDQSHARLVKRLEDKDGIVPECVILAGDQVYVDPTAGLFDPSVETDKKLYKPYENWLRQDKVRTTLRQLPAYMQLDDHEIKNDWEPFADGSNTGIRNAGVNAYRRFQRGYHDDKDNGKNNDYRFRFEGFPFYMLDTRSARKGRKAKNLKSSKLIEAASMTELKKWLLSSKGPKFVVTPSMLLPRHRKTQRWSAPGCAIHADGWDGYPDTLHELLAYVVDEEIKQLVFLSGDEHIGCVATVDIIRVSDSLKARTHSIHSSPLFAPLPFANAGPADFVAPVDDKLDFTHGNHKYHCEVKSSFPPPGDGFVFLRPYQNAGAWKLDYEFPDGQVSTLSL